MDSKTAISELEEMLQMMGFDRRTVASLNSPYQDVRSKRSFMMQFDARMDALQFAIDAINALHRMGEAFAVECDHYDGDYWAKYFMDEIKRKREEIKAEAK